MDIYVFNRDDIITSENVDLGEIDFQQSADKRSQMKSKNSEQLGVNLKINGGIRMNGKQQAVDQIHEFLKSNEKSMLITGTHQYEKHKLIMKILNQYFNNARILFRINGMDNITDNSFIGLSKKPAAGARVELGNNYYEFDSFNTTSTWYKTSNDFNFAILYPIDALCRSLKKESIENLFEQKNIEKIFLCSWTDRVEYDYSRFSEFYSRHVIYDAQEEDPEYHQRVLER